MASVSVPAPTSVGPIVLRTAYRNYSAAERVGVVVFGVIAPLILIPVGVFLLVTVGPQANALAYMLPILGAVMMAVILSDHAPQVIALHPVGVETKRLWKQQRADARDIVFILGLHRNNRHVMILVKRDNTAIAFGPGLTPEDFGRARAWVRNLAQRQGIPDEGDVNITGRSDAARAMTSVLSKYNLGTGGRRR